jgi:hypothetical protein
MKNMEKSFITIVAGLPRSGTSMMMQAIEAGGIPALTDGIREKDVDNPKGYYEFEAVKKTKADASWVSEAEGKVVKMVYSLLYDLPDDHAYRVVFLQREMKEVLASQRKMLERTGEKGASIGDEKLSELFKAQLDKFHKWIADKDNFSIVLIDYKNMIKFPAEQAEKVDELLGNILDKDGFVSAVDPSLYRNRS